MLHLLHSATCSDMLSNHVSILTQWPPFIWPIYIELFDSHTLIYISCLKVSENMCQNESCLIFIRSSTIFPGIFIGAQHFVCICNTH